MTWESLSTSPLDAILDWARGEPWGEAMAACQQDAAWHAEGDVWTHTVLVCRQLERLEEWPSLSSHERIVLIFTALFHDAGKPLTSQLDPITGRITSPKHAIQGEHLVRSMLRELACPLAVREEIARMVRVHGRPPFLLEKPKIEREVISHSWWVTNRLLYLFALADTRGRRTAEMGRPEENLHFWKLAAEESECFTQPYGFANDQARFRYLRQPDANRHFVPHEFYRCTVTMMSGLPGSGKDRWLATHHPELPVVSLDDIRGELDVHATDDQGEVIQLAKERCREQLRASTSFAFNATNLLRQTRQRWIELFADYEARIEIVYVEPPLSVVLRQNRERERRVPELVIHQLAAKMEPPTWSEAHHLRMCEEVE
jgi:predicted kinase